jgi:hypothetical protein
MEGVLMPVLPVAKICSVQAHVTIGEEEGLCRELEMVRRNELSR